MALAIVFDEVNGLIRIADSDPSFSTMEGLISIIDPQGVSIYKNAGFDAGTFTSPDLNSANPEFTTQIPLTSGVSLEGEYTFEYKTKTAGVDEESTLVEKVVIWRPDRAKICIDHTTNCLCSKLELEDVSRYGEAEVLTRSWTATPPAPSGETATVGTNSTLVVGPNIWTGTYDSALTVTVEIDHGDSVSSKLILKGYLEVRVECESKSKIYNSLSAVNDKYESLLKTSPGEAMAYQETLQTATTFAQLAELAFDLGKWNAYESFLSQLTVIAPDCDCDDCGDCGDEYPREIEALCSGGSSGGINSEEVMDLISQFLIAGDNIRLVYNDPANTLTISAIIDTPEGITNSYFRFNTVSGEWESGGGNGTFIRVLDGQSYTVDGTIEDPVLYVSEGSSVILPAPTSLDSRALITFVHENTDTTEPPESSSMVIQGPKGAFATITATSFGFADNKVNTSNGSFDSIELLNGRTISLGIGENNGTKYYIPKVQASRYTSDPKLPKGLLTGQGLAYNTLLTDNDGFPGRYQASYLDSYLVNVGQNATHNALPRQVILAQENSTVVLPPSKTALDEGYKIVVSHENSSANQAYGTSEILIECGGVLGLGENDNFDTIGSVGGGSFEPSRVAANGTTQSLTLRNGETAHLFPMDIVYANGSIFGRYWAGYLTNRFEGGSGSSGSVSWGDITGTLSTQSDLASALGLKLDSSAYSAADVASKYASQVGQVSSTEITNGTATSLKTFSPADVKAMIDQHGSGAAGFLDSYDTRTALTTAYATPPSAASWAIIKENVELAVEDGSGAWKFQYVEGYTLDSATVTALENDANFTSGVFSGTGIAATDLLAGKRHTKTGSDNIIYLCVNPSSPYWVRMDVSGGGGGSATNLGYIADPATGTVTSDTGINATLTAVTSTNAGLMTPAQNDKLNDIEPEATADLSGSEIEALLDTELGNTSWKSSGGDMASSTYDPSGISEQVVGTSASQSLSNKTLVSPIVSGDISPVAANSLELSDGGSGTGVKAMLTASDATSFFSVVQGASNVLFVVDGTGAVTAGPINGVNMADVVQLTATQNVSNKTILSSTMIINGQDLYVRDASDSSKVIKFDGSGITTGNTRTITMPDSDVDLGDIGATNLAYTASPTDGTVTSDTGNNATVPLADATNAGLLSPTDFTKLADSVDIDGTGATDGSGLKYDLANSKYIVATGESVDATAGDAGTVKLDGETWTNSYGKNNPHTLSTIVVDGTTLVERGSADIRVQSAAKPSTYTLAGATFVEVGDWSGWDASNVNRIGMTCRIAGGSAVIDLWYAGAE